jgi:hypothetical protein
MGIGGTKERLELQILRNRQSDRPALAVAPARRSEAIDLAIMRATA